MLIGPGADVASSCVTCMCFFGLFPMPLSTANLSLAAKSSCCATSPLVNFRANTFMNSAAAPKSSNNETLMLANLLCTQAHRH